MAVLETIRTKVGWLITALIAFSLLSFIVDFNSLSSAINSSLSKYTVGRVNGEKVPYKDFQEQVEYQTRIMEMVNGNRTTTEEAQTAVRQAAWQHYVDQYLFLKNAKEAGIEVGDKELVDLVSGDAISPVIAYDPMLGDMNGNFDRQRLNEFLAQIPADQTGNLQMYWNYLQNTVLTQQYYAKYGSLFNSSAYVNALSLKTIEAQNNNVATVKVVSVPFSYLPDSTITVSSSEIKKYYSAHKNQFKQVANRDIAYAVLEVVPSDADRDAASAAIQDVYDEFATTENVKNFLMRNSDMPLSNIYYKAGELTTVNRDINDFVFEGKDKVSPVIKDGDSYYVARVVDTKVLPDSVYVRHIMIQNDNALADSLLTVLNAGKADFSQLAAMYSADQMQRGLPTGDLGWLTQYYMFPGMESVMTAQVNKPYIIDTQYGRHIVEVTKKTKGIEKKQVAILQKTAVPSKATMNDFYNRANTLATQAAGKLDKLREAATANNVYLHEINVTEATANYGGATHAKEVTRWIFEAKKGEASNVITVNQNFLIVAAVKEIHEEGYRTVAEASASISSFLKRQKQNEKLLAEVKEKIAGCADIDAVAAALGKEVSTEENISFASRYVDPAVAGAASSCEPGKVSEPVLGASGVFVVSVADRTEKAFFTDSDVYAQEGRKVQQTTNMILPVMLDSSNSVDNRERFF